MKYAQSFTKYAEYTRIEEKLQGGWISDYHESHAIIRSWGK